jgi:DUF4097 and DUF4098 domain-containing protein YvlB
LLAAALPSHAAVDGRFDRTFPVSSPLKVDIVTEAGEISVHGGEPGKIEIHAKIHGSDDSQDDANVESRVRAIEMNPPITLDNKGHSVRIGHFASPDLARDVSITYEIVVPIETQLHVETSTGNQTVEGVRGPVDATTGSGNLHVWHIGLDTHVDTGSGEIDLRDVHGRVHARAGTGTVRVNGIVGELSQAERQSRAQLLSGRAGQPLVVQITLTSGADTEIITGSGDVDVEDLEGGLQVTTGSGNIRASGRPLSDWHLDTGTGTVRVQFSMPANLALVAHTSAGTIEAHDSITVHGTASPHELRGQVGQGGPTVELKTASGNIEIE